MLKVYLASLGSRFPNDLELEYLKQIPQSIRTAILRYRRWEDRQATLLGKLLLQRALRKRIFDYQPSTLESIEYTESGKPFIREAPGFNISHSAEMVALALVDSGQVGIDVEKIRPIKVEDFSRYLPEILEMDNTCKSERLNRFYTCWTMKEAVLKGYGSGLLVPLEQVTLDSDKAFLNGQLWRLQRIDCGTDYICHLATNDHQAGCSIEVVNF